MPEPNAAHGGAPGPSAPGPASPGPTAPRKALRPSTALYPEPAVLVSSAAEIDGQRRDNVLTIAWSGVCSSEPPMVSVAIRKSRFSHRLISASGEFVVNVPPASLVGAVDLCGNVRGETEDKFALAGLTRAPATAVGAPLVAECPIAMECRVRHVYEAGSHDVFIGEVVALTVSESALDAEGRIDVARVDPLCYGGGDYWRLAAETLGVYGFSRK